jgi:S-formylglutathione hydrolase FrmB
MFRAALLTLACSAPALAQLQGTVQQLSFHNPVTNGQPPFSLYLPPGYAASIARYPVIYHLHGIGGSHAGPQTNTVPASFEAARNQGLIGPVIIVFPNGYTDAWWADSFDGAKPAETDVLQLIAHIDASYRTIPTREARIIQGFSMGGFGATKFYSKFPDLFLACIEYDGALATWATMQQSHPALAASIFGSSEAYYNLYSPWHWTGANVPALAAANPIRMVVGSLVGGNRTFRDHLLSLTIPVDYVETGCGHDIGCLFNAQGLASAAFIAARLAAACPANCDASTTPPVLNVQDFACFLNRFASGDSRANCDGSTAVPTLNILDFACFLNAFAAGCP